MWVFNRSKYISNKKKVSMQNAYNEIKRKPQMEHQLRQETVETDRLI